MNNLVYIIGRLTNEPEIKNTPEGKSQLIINVEVPRTFKNEEGIYEVDIIECTLWNNIANNVSEYCKKGDLVGIKGRVQTRTNNEKRIIEIITEKVSFLSSKKED